MFSTISPNRVPYVQKSPLLLVLFSKAPTNTTHSEERRRKWHHACWLSSWHWASSWLWLRRERRTRRRELTGGQEGARKASWKHSVRVWLTVSFDLWRSGVTWARSSRLRQIAWIHIFENQTQGRTTDKNYWGITEPELRTVDGQKNHMGYNKGRLNDGRRIKNYRGGGQNPDRGAKKGGEQKRSP